MKRLLKLCGCFSYGSREVIESSHSRSFVPKNPATQVSDVMPSARELFLKGVWGVDSLQKGTQAKKKLGILDKQFFEPPTEPLTKDISDTKAMVQPPNFSQNFSLEDLQLSADSVANADFCSNHSDFKKDSKSGQPSSLRVDIDVNGGKNR